MFSFMGINSYTETPYKYNLSRPYGAIMLHNKNYPLHRLNKLQSWYGRKEDDMDRQNLTLMTDLYELTMMQGYYKNKDQNETVIFDAFYRTNPCGGGYAISAGLEQVIQYIRELDRKSVV